MKVSRAGESFSGLWRLFFIFWFDIRMKLARAVRDRETKEGLLTPEETDESEKYWLKDAQSG